MSGLYRIQGALDALTETNVQRFRLVNLIKSLAGVNVVEVVSCTNSGGVSPFGLVNVRPLVNQINGDVSPTPHGVVYNLVYSRLQGGTNAVIMDPEPGDHGIAIFCSRDISAVKAAAASAPGSPISPQNPASLRWWDWADGAYIGWCLNGVPLQYIQFLTGIGINVVSPGTVTVNAGQLLNLNGATGVNINGNGNTVIDGVTFLPHTHDLVQSGSDNSGGVVT
jgi:hypothetical protein